MKEYLVSWIESKSAKVEANSEEEAKEKAMMLPNDELDTGNAEDLEVTEEV